MDNKLRVIGLELCDTLGIADDYETRKWDNKKPIVSYEDYKKANDAINKALGVIESDDEIPHRYIGDKYIPIDERLQSDKDLELYRIIAYAYQEAINADGSVGNIGIDDFVDKCVASKNYDDEVVEAIKHVVARCLYSKTTYEGNANTLSEVEKDKLAKQLTYMSTLNLENNLLGLDKEVYDFTKALIEQGKFAVGQERTENSKLLIRALYRGRRVDISIINRFGYDEEIPDSYVFDNTDDIKKVLELLGNVTNIEYDGNNLDTFKCDIELNNYDVDMKDIYNDMVLFTSDVKKLETVNNEVVATDRNGNRVTDKELLDVLESMYGKVNVGKIKYIYYTVNRILDNIANGLVPEITFDLYLEGVEWAANEDKKGSGRPFVNSLLTDLDLFEYASLIESAIYKLRYLKQN